LHNRLGNSEPLPHSKRVAADFLAQQRVESHPLHRLPYLLPADPPPQRSEQFQVLLASHNAGDIEELCDTVCEMDAGIIQEAAL
ncbi:MAG: hypothetical protein HDQ87_05855, partial [Clostridia bacterium]|nr:hypothetical protein [Clostridia bacterium]